MCDIRGAEEFTSSLGANWRDATSVAFFHHGVFRRGHSHILGTSLHCNHWAVRLATKCPINSSERPGSVVKMPLTSDKHSSRLLARMNIT